MFSTYASKNHRTYPENGVSNPPTDQSVPPHPHPHQHIRSQCFLTADPSPQVRLSNSHPIISTITPPTYPTTQQHAIPPISPDPGHLPRNHPTHHATHTINFCLLSSLPPNTPPPQRTIPQHIASTIVQPAAPPISQPSSSPT